MTDPDTPAPRPVVDRHTRLARLALVVYWPLLATATHWPSLSLIGTPGARVPMLQSDKVGHLTAFALLAALLIRAKPVGARRPAIVNLLAAAAIALVYAAIDELTQRYAFERTVSISDYVANAIAIVGVLLIALTPPVLNPPPTARALRASRRWLGAAVAGIFVGGLVLSISGTINRETYAIHFIAGAAFGLNLLRAAPLWPSRPRVGVVLACAGVGLTIAVSEIAQAVSGLPYSRDEAFFGQVGLLLAMVLRAARLVLAELTGADDARQPPDSADVPSDPPDPVPTNPPRA